MPVEFMTAEAQNRLLGLAKQAVELARDGDYSPADALVKVAGDAQLNANEINRVKEAINTAAVLALRKRAAAGDGASDDIIPMINGDEVLGRVFKKAAAPDTLAMSKVAEEIVEESRSFMARPQAAMEKVASTSSTPKDSAPREVLYARVHGHLGQLKIAAETHREEAASHRFAAERRIGDVLDFFSGTAAPAFAEVEKVASALYPEEGLSLVFDLVYKGGDLGKIGHKRHTGELPKYASVDDHADIIAKIKQIRDDLGYSLLAKVAEEEVRAKFDRGSIELFKLAADDGSGFNPLSAVSPVLGAATSALGSIGDSAMSAAHNVAGESEEGMDLITPRNHKGSTNERLKNELGNDRSRVVLAKVMNEDPVVAKYPQDKVAQAYNELTTLQPALSAQPLALRAALRRYLVSGGDFTMQEATQMRDFNKEQDKIKAKHLDSSVMKPAPKMAQK